MSDPKSPQSEPTQEHGREDTEKTAQGQEDASVRQAEPGSGMPGYGQPPPEVRNPNVGGK